DPRTHAQIAANTITGNADDIFGLQDNLFAEVLEKLPTAVDPGRQQSLRGRPDTKPAAYDFYLRGRGYLEDYQRPDNIESAIAQFQRSLDLDHTSDETLRMLAAAYQKQGKASAAEEAYRKAISLRPTYWLVYSAFGTFYYNQARYLDAAAMFQKSIKLAPLN